MPGDNQADSDSGDVDADGPFTALYDRAAESLLDGPIEEKYVGAGKDRTHLLTAGDPSDPPVIVFQGGNVTTPVTFSWVQGLADDYYLVAPDTPGQPGKTAGETPQAYGPWAVDLLDELDLGSAAMIGISHGGGIVLEAAVDAPDRIDAAALLVPAGFGTALSVDLLRVILPSLAYRFLPERRLLQQALAPLFTQPVSTVDETILETVGQALRTGDLRAEFPGPDDMDALAAFEAPTLVVTAKHDPFFPGRRTCKRAERALRSLHECLMLTDERHFLSPAGQHRATELIREFLTTQASVSR